MFNMLLLLTRRGGYRALMRENEKCIQENVNEGFIFKEEIN